MTKVLVAGGAGYIGSHIVYELIDAGFGVLVLDDLSTGHIENVAPRAKFVNGNINDVELIDSLLKDIDVVIHLAASKAAGDSMVNPEEYSENNIIHSTYLLNSCLKNKVKKIIFSSTAAVYGFPQYLPIDEDHDLKPINYYGFTKLVIEQQLNWLCKLKNIKVACLRYFNAAGYDNSGRVKQKENNPQNLLPIVMEVANRSRKELEIYGSDYNTKDGTCMRDYIHVNDLATAHVKSIDALDGKNHITLNLATGNSYSILDVIAAAKRVTGRPIPYRIVDRRPGDPDKLYSDSMKAKNIIDWEPEFSDLDTIIDSMWKIYKN